MTVLADDGDTSTNHIDVQLETNPPRSITLDTCRGDSLDVLDEEDFGPADEALYYAVERIAQLEAENTKLRNELQHQTPDDEGTAAYAYFYCQTLIEPYLGDRCGPNSLSNSVCESLTFLIKQWQAE
jgi:hypothetical protein